MSLRDKFSSDYSDDGNLNYFLHFPGKTFIYVLLITYVIDIL